MAGKTWDQIIAAGKGAIADASWMLFHTQGGATFPEQAVDFYAYLVGKLQPKALAFKDRVAVSDLADNAGGLGYVPSWDAAGHPTTVALPAAVGGGSGLTTTATKTGTYAANANERVPASTASASWTLTLPPAPANGTVVETFDPVAGGSWQANALTVARGGSSDVILAGTSTATSVALTAPGGYVSLVYVGGTWYARQTTRTRPLEANRNLAEVTDPVASRSSLGLVIGTNVQAFAAFLSALASSAGDGVLARLTGGTVGVIGGGTDGYVLTWDSTQPFKVKWAAAVGGGGGSSKVPWGAFVQGQPQGGDVLLLEEAEVSSTLAAGLTGSHFYAKTGPAASVTIPILKNAVQQGTLTWAVGANRPTVSFASAVTWAAGDIFEVDMQAATDANLRDVTFCFVRT